jgi:hypothetical protein
MRQCCAECKFYNGTKFCSETGFIKGPDGVCALFISKDAEQQSSKART